MQLVMGGLVMVMGCISAGVGVALIHQALRAVHRAHGRTCSLSKNGWDEWFVSGFSGLGMGIRWCGVIAAWLMWTGVGIGLIILGFQLFHRF